LSFANSIITESISEAIILYSPSNILFLANALSFSEVSHAKSPNFSKANALFNHGAIFFAIISASIAIVQLPQKGSKNISLNLQFDNKTKAAAKDSLIGASQAFSLYPLI
jgi:hypothetical protein